MKHKQPHLGFELGSPVPFFMTTTIILNMPPHSPAAIFQPIHIYDIPFYLT